MIQENVSETQQNAKRSTNCNICDQLAAELGEMLIRWEKHPEVRQPKPGGSSDAADVEQIATELRAAKQHFIDHRRLIHPRQ